VDHTCSGFESHMEFTCVCVYYYTLVVYMHGFVFGILDRFFVCFIGFESHGLCACVLCVCVEERERERLRTRESEWRKRV
jgi:hypothetical protein